MTTHDEDMVGDTGMEGDVGEQQPALTVVAGSERLPVTGRAALVIYLVAAHAAEVNQEDVGKLVAAFAHGQTKVELRRSLEALRLRPPMHT